MTVLDTPDVDETVVPITGGALAADDAKRLATGASAPESEPDAEFVEPALPLAAMARPALAAALATSAAGLVVGGIFGSFAARGFGLLAAFAGAGWALFAERSERTQAVQAATPLVLLVAGLLTLVPAPGGPGALPTLVGDAFDAGRLIRPPVPFDPGWRVIILMVIGLIGFASASVGLTYGRPKLAVLVPLPLVGLASLTQPESEQFVTGLCAFLPVLAALGVLFGGDSTQTADLDRSFEVKRLVRGLVAGIPVVALLVAANNASFLFPKPVYDPDDKPQKPKAAPLSAADDRVLFEVKTGSTLTGPWRIGALDVYDDNAFLIAGFNRKRLVPLPGDGRFSTLRVGATQESVTVTVRDLGDSGVLPILAGTTKVTADKSLVIDPRSLTLRVPTGRAPAGLAYTMQLPGYASGEDLEAVTDTPGAALADQLLAPTMPDAVANLVAAAPQNRWQRLDFLRQKLLANVTASGAGAPKPVPPSKVADLLTGSKKGTPFEIVAAEALLARWAGVPSRIGFGFDGLNDEKGTFTVRPRNAAQWLEVWFEGYGWVPLIGSPKKAEASLDSDPNKRFNPTIEPSSDVAVEVYLPYELEDLTQLYQRVRDLLVRYLPVVVLLGGAWIGWPVAAKVRRRAKRRAWAAVRDPRRQVVVEYAELRDACIDLGVGDIYDTPLEYLSKVRDDAEHRELAWLAARSLYGDMIETVTAQDALAAEELSTSIRRRLAAAQPLQLRFLAAVSRASIAQPYTEEIPNVAHLRIPGAAWLRRRRTWLQAVVRRRLRRTPVPMRLAGDAR